MLCLQKQLQGSVSLTELVCCLVGTRAWISSAQQIGKIKKRSGEGSCREEVFYLEFWRWETAQTHL